MLKKMLEYFWNLTTSSQPKLRKKKEDIEVGYIFTIEGKPFKCIAMKPDNILRPLERFNKFPDISLCFKIYLNIQKEDLSIDCTSLWKIDLNLSIISSD